MANPDSLLSWLGATSVRCSLLIVVVLALQFALRSWIAARWRLLLWFPVLAVMAVPFLPECGWSLDKWVVQRPANTELCCPSATLDCAPVADAPSSASLPTSARLGWLVILGCWLSGAVWFLGVVVWSYARSLRRCQRQPVPATREVAELVRLVAGRIGLRKAPRLLVSPLVGSPAVTGIFRPTLLLPAAFPGGLQEPEWHLVIEHELLHIRRYDLWTSWLLCLLQAIHWFNPVVWLAFRKIRLDCEEARDEEVLGQGDKDRRTSYGAALIKMAGAFGNAELQLGILRMAPSLAGLRSRIRAVASFRKPHRAWAIVWAALISGVTLAGATRSPAPKPPALASADGGPEAGVTVAKSIVIPRFCLEGVPVAEALERWRAAARAADPAARGVSIWLTPEGARSARDAKVSVALRDISAWEALVAIAGQANLGIDGTGHLLCVKWPFVTRAWTMEEPQLRRLGLADDSNLKAWLAGQGVGFPEGSSAQATAVAEGRRRLVRVLVRNSQENLQRIAILFGSGQSTSQLAAPIAL